MMGSFDTGNGDEPWDPWGSGRGPPFFQGAPLLGLGTSRMDPLFFSQQRSIGHPVFVS